MRRKPESSSIVLAGFWNRMIFTPEWVNARLFPGVDNLEAMVALLPVMPVIFRDDEVAVEISHSRIVLKPRNQSNAGSLQRAGRLAAAILQALPETPIP